MAQCSVCSKSLKSDASLRSHQKSCRESERWDCGVCLNTYTRKTSLERHRLRHIGVRHPCKVCPLTYANKDGLWRHTRIHHSSHPPAFPCVICGKYYNNKQQQERHLIQEHQKSRTWPCPDCPYESGDKALLDAHLKARHSPKLFECGICPKMFAVKAYMKRHQASHMAPKPCPECDFKTKYDESLSLHIAHKHRDGGVRCWPCNKKFVTGSVYTRHLSSNGHKDFL